MDERIGKGKKKEYFVKCKGWEALDDHTWEPVDSIGGSKKLIKEYEKRIEEINKKKLPENPLPQNTAKTELSFFGYLTLQ